MLEQHLSQLVADVNGASGAAIGGFDGLLVEGHGAPSANLGLLVAEHAGLLRAAFGAFENTLAGGQVRELYLRGDALSLYSLPMSAELFLMVVLNGAGNNLGQARLYGLATAQKLLEEL